MKRSTIACILAAGVLLPAVAHGAVSTTPSVGVDPLVRSSVRTFDTAVYPASNGIAVNWTGSTGSCSVGTQNQDYRNAGILRVNYYRRLVGLPDVGEDTAASAKCSQAALMMHSNGALSHTPPTGWSCHTAAGAEAAGKSNLAMNSGMTSGVAIAQYMDDSGSFNTAVGHRRWILYPPLTNVGHGDTTQYNCLWVIESGSHTTIWGTRPSAPGWIAWPYAGYFPTARLPGSTRWSYSINGANFGTASVSVRNDAGTAMTTPVEVYDDRFADNTLVWRVTGADASSPGTGERPYHVELRGITGASGRSVVHYTVLLIDTTQTRTDEARRSATVAATTATCEEGGAPAVFTVTLAAAAERDTWINYALGGTAGTGEFTTTGKLKILQGQTTGTLSITGVSDAVTEAGGETVAITLDPGCAYTLGATTTATVTILDPGSVPNTPPVITQGASTTLTVNEDTPGSLTLNATDADGDTLSWSVSSQGTKGTASASGTGASKLIGFTPAANQNGSDPVVIQVSDGRGGTDAITVSVTISPVNDAPVRASLIPDRSASVGTVFSYVVPSGTFTDVDGDTLTWSSNEALSWLTFTAGTRTFSGTPAAGDIGSTTITVTAGDGTLSANDAFILTVSATPDTTPPATPSAPSTSSTTSALPTLSGTTEPGASIQIRDNGVLVATAVADGAGAWSWTPSTPLAPGAHALTVVAVDGTGNASSPSPSTTVTVPGGSSAGSGTSGGVSGGASGSGGCGLGALALVLAGILLPRWWSRRG